MEGVQIYLAEVGFEQKSLQGSLKCSGWLNGHRKMSDVQMNDRVIVIAARPNFREKQNKKRSAVEKETSQNSLAHAVE